MAPLSTQQVYTRIIQLAHRRKNPRKPTRTYAPTIPKAHKKTQNTEDAPHQTPKIQEKKKKKTPKNQNVRKCCHQTSKIKEKKPPKIPKKKKDPIKHPNPTSPKTINPKYKQI
jgi:hypothetical protein